jgi:hypothetical protein
LAITEKSPDLSSRRTVFLWLKRLLFLCSKAAFIFSPSFLFKFSVGKNLKKDPNYIEWQRGEHPKSAPIKDTLFKN